LTLPSKKITPLILACLVALGLIIFGVFYKPKAQNKAPQILSVVSQSENIQNKILDVDSDNDGLKDWEETLWGTDPHKADTDGDGTSDGKEVEAGRNPTKKGPNDTLTSQAIADKTATATKDKELTATDKLARELFTEYYNLKQSGKEITPEIQNQILQTSLQTQLSQSLTAPTTYALAQVHITTDTSPNALRVYGNTMGTIILKDAPALSESELSTLQRAVENNDEKELAKLDIIVGSYQKMLNDMLAVNVPQEVATLHLNVVNNLSAVVYGVKGMRNAFKDPVSTLMALKSYEDAAVTTEDTFAAISLFFKSKNVVYSTNEPGYRFVNNQ
jgi:hypothetical protein